MTIIFINIIICDDLKLGNSVCTLTLESVGTLDKHSAGVNPHQVNSPMATGALMPDLSTLYILFMYRSRATYHTLCPSNMHVHIEPGLGLLMNM